MRESLNWTEQSGRENSMKDVKRQKDEKREPTVAPGYDDRKFGEKASREDKARGDYTRVTRVYLDENDPSR
jgi:hypothetical protein